MTFIIPMAGKGSRFQKEGYQLPKYMIKVKDKTLFEYSMESLPIEIATKIIFICLKSHEEIGVSEFIKKNVNHNNIEIIFLDEITRGQAETVYMAKEYVDKGDELLIYNIDTSFKSNKLKSILLDNNFKNDGVIGSFINKSNDDKWSFAKLDSSNHVIQTTEKDKISDYALTGLYHFKYASDFFDIAEKCIHDNITVRNEFYIAPLYNYLITKNKKYVLDIVDEFIPLGTPQEVRAHLKTKTSGIILTAAEADITICEVFGSLPTGLIPVNGKPIIFFILEQFLEAKIIDVYIGIDYKKDKIQKIINLYFKNKLNIKYVLTDKSKGVGNSFLKILSVIKTDKVIVNLADTYIKNMKLNELEDSVIVSNDYLNEEKWATVELSDNKTIKKFHDKVKIKNALVLSGVYSFSNASVFDKFSVLSDNVEITEILNFYNSYISLTSKKTDNWLDFGHIDKYYVSKKKLIQSRGFNSLEYNDLLGTITKRSQNKEKFISEIKWQLDLPKNIQVLAPRILDYSIGDNPFITMEFYSYPTLSEIWLFSELNEKMYYSIIDKLFKILELFKENKCDVSYENYISIYINKTEERIHQIENKDIFSFMKNDNITINGKILKNWNYLKKYVYKQVKSLYHKNDNCFIHGDFCLSNILYDLRSGLVRVIDPRGIWGDDENGDIKYDIAKLSHSIVGDYDYIVNDLFEINIKNNEITYAIYNSEKDNIKKYFNQIVSNYYNINQIKLIEGLLFLSMIPLHEDKPQRQIMMYSKSIEIFNEVIR